MRIHRPPPGIRFVVQIRMGVELRKKFLDIHHPQHEHPGLVTIISRAPVTLLKGTRNGDIGKFLAVAENTKFCLAT